MKKACGLLALLTLLYIKGFGQTNSSATAKSFYTSQDTTKKVVVKDTSKATADSSDDDVKMRSYAIGVQYGSDQSFHGLHSNKALPYIQPNFTYTAPKGFYVEVCAQDMLISKGGGFDNFDINPGWDIDLTDNTILNFNFTKYFFQPGTPVIILQDLSNTAETYVEQWIGDTKGKISFDYDFYKNNASIKTPNDFVVSPDVEHDFEITLGKKSSISINPEANMGFGTRNAWGHLAANTGEDTTENETNKQQVMADTILTPAQMKEVQQSPNPSAEKKTLIMQNKNALRSQLQAQQKKGTTINNGFGTLNYTLILTVDFKIGKFELEPAFNFVSTLYNPPGITNKPIGYVTVALTYTIDHKPKH